MAADLYTPIIATLCDGSIKAYATVYLPDSSAEVIWEGSPSVDIGEARLRAVQMLPGALVCIACGAGYLKRTGHQTLFGWTCCVECREDANDEN